MAQGDRPSIPRPRPRDGSYNCRVYPSPGPRNDAGLRAERRLHRAARTRHPGGESMFRSSLFVLVVAVAGCAGSVDTVGVTSETQELTVPNSNGTYVASVTANGTGCPKGTWDVSIDPAG